MPKVSVILPTYNEALNIKRLIEEISKNLKRSFEIIVVDDDSPDKTWKVVEDYNNPNVKLIRRTGRKGLATAIYRGIEESKGDVIGWMDGDICMPPSKLPEMLACLDKYDIAIGSRYVKGGRDTRGIFRVITSRAINWFAGLLMGFDIKDYDSGFIVLKRYVFDKVTFPPWGYGEYFIDFIYRCKRAGFSIKEVPYVFQDRTKGTSKTAVNGFAFIKLGFAYILRTIYSRFSKQRQER